MAQEKTRIFDLHCDTLDRLAWPLLPDELNGGHASYAPGDEGSVERGTLQDFAISKGHLSLNAMSGFSWCQCLAVFIPDQLAPDEAARFFDVVSRSLPSHVAAHPDLLGVARCASEVDEVLGSGKTCGFLTIEGGGLLAASPDMLEKIAAAGVRMVTLTWNGANPLGSGHETHQGLTDFGAKSVGALERRHIAVDVSHLNDEGFWDVARISKRPFAASHSNSRAVRDVPRNLTDDQFRAIRDAGGVVGLNFCRSFISGEKDPSPDELLAHVEHWLDLGGERVVALGSDYDGSNVPSWLEPCDKMRGLVKMMRQRFGDEQAERLCFGNAREFFSRVEAD
ncbi:MAG: dipeptidase [Tractidigestivibacter sp.]|jgi:membrane dipeptidase|uniref:dipeptidase n=1 Tax=Tractidigestivibacter sp. TaxID=2847320 RepID=UPI003D8EA704